MSAAFVASMEDVLELYEEPYDVQRPVVCFDETSTQLIEEKRVPTPARPGQQERFDYEYQRNGTRNLFLLREPLRGWRHVAVTEQRAMQDFARQMQWLTEEVYPDAARRILRRLEFHYTPKHGSWLNMAEIELSVVSRQCLNRRIGEEATLKREVAALERQRNAAREIIHWQFTAKDARHRLRHLYPSISA